MRVPLVVVACLVFAAPASGHTLTAAGAERMTQRFVMRAAASADPMPRTVLVGPCLRRTRHRVDCLALFRFGGVACDRFVRVRFTSEHHRRVSVVFVGSTSCS